MMVVDQREVQRRGGVCGRIPVACMVADLLLAGGLRAERLVVVDATFGEGRFWAAVRPRLLIAVDPAIPGWVTMPDIYIPKPVWQASRVLEALSVRADLVAVDPPWIERGSSKRRHYGLDRALGSPRLIMEKTIELAEKLGATWLLVHYKTRWIPEGWVAIAEKEWLPVTRYIDYSKQKPTTWWGLLCQQ